MNRQRRILIVDASEKWRMELTKILQYRGFFVDAASSHDEALRRLSESLYHLLMVSIRIDETNPHDRKGWDLLDDLNKLDLTEAVKVIILSNDATREEVRRAFRDYSVIDFFFKEDFNQQMFLETTERAFAGSVKINLTLDLHWQQISGPEKLTSYLKMKGVHVKQNIFLRNLLALELDDLLCRLFLQADSVLLRPFTPRVSSTGVLSAQPFYTRGAGRVVVVKYGDVHTIEQEERNFTEFIQPFIVGGRSTSRLSLRRTPHLGGILYSMVGADDDTLENFGTFYRRASTSQIKGVLDNVFLKTCSPWYTNKGSLQLYNLTEDYQQLLGLTLQRLEHARALLKSVQGSQKLFFKSLGNERTFSNPLFAMKGLPLLRSTYICITHGDLNQHNLLVDKSRHTWLIDFQRTGYGHILRDIAQLDSVIRFVLLSSEEATLEDRLHMEEVLCGIKHFSQIKQMTNSLISDNQALMKAYVTVMHLRSLAQHLVAKNVNNDISEYYIALFYNAMNILRFYGLSSTQREHALLCASLLAEQPGLALQEGG